MKFDDRQDISTADEQWLQSFAGEQVEDADPRDARAAGMIREAFLEHLEDHPGDGGSGDGAMFDPAEITDRQEKLRAKLMAKGKLPPRGGTVEQLPIRATSRWTRQLAMAAVLALGVGVGLHMIPQQNPGDERNLTERVARGLGDGVFYLQVSDPAADARTLGEALQRLGIESAVFEAEANWYVEVELPEALPSGVEALETRYGISLPAGGSVLVEFRRGGAD